MSHVYPKELHNIGLSYCHASKSPLLFHDLSHIWSSFLLDARACELSASLMDLSLVLERFRPGTNYIDQESDKPLVDMSETLKAWSVCIALVKHATPWDLLPEVTMDFVNEKDHFLPTNIPFYGYYRHASYPAF